ncbi:unnamed protein product [Leptidea sinapis]|uniref:Uncharacterized protein n=2 Tax=Leptidea sinapis TaxID=189913 RepID=A0A5E4Q0Q1_9NEOP|nr:unnamed protein product [Leptidea sinapis]
MSTRAYDTSMAQVRLTAGVDVDGIMVALGQAGRYHVRVFIMVALAAFQVGLLHTTYIFLAGSVPYR